MASFFNAKLLIATAELASKCGEEAVLELIALLDNPDSTDLNLQVMHDFLAGKAVA